MLYELTTISSPPLELTAVSTAAHNWVLQGEGRLLGAWRTEIGELHQIKLLRGFETAEALERERLRVLMSARPFNVDDPAGRLSMEQYARFPFLPDVEPSAFGRFYELRTYYLKPGGLAPTLEAWEQAIGPAHDYTQHLVINMYALDGLPRITHIWGFSSLEERAALRARHYADGTWPPKGAPQQLARATSTICIAEAYSPLG
ncbi:NIPSNAP family protein [Pseudomonas typographi]|uniref:NIPSNAP family protein n=1 Tax=Pseudomonas typographi TaxID=2715964 RepID=UPI0016827E22|nr:NIPSNAP family protein [Pseudomonas typographi]MBD1554459.1 NIPSNAP family protein [Pseudomonas typographi]